jgi:hypothetical protein
VKGWGLCGCGSILASDDWFTLLLLRSLAPMQELGVLFGKLNDAVNKEDFDTVVSVSDLSTFFLFIKLAFRFDILTTFFSQFLRSRLRTSTRSLASASL